jgi:hypothetical protein
MNRSCILKRVYVKHNKVLGSDRALLSLDALFGYKTHIVFVCVKKNTTHALSPRASQILLRDAHVLQYYLAMRNTAVVTGGKSIAD